MILLYIFSYNDNECAFIHENVSLLYKTMYDDNNYSSLYKKIYNDNKHFHYTIRCICHYTRRCIMTTNISLIHENVSLLYKMMFNDNDHCHFITINKSVYNDKKNISVIHDSVFLIIRDDV